MCLSESVIEHVLELEYNITPQDVGAYRLLVVLSHAQTPPSDNEKKYLRLHSLSCSHNIM